MIRKGTPKDAEAIEKIRITGWQSAYRDFMPEDFLSSLTSNNNLPSLRERLSPENDEVSYLLFEDNVAVKGFCSFGVPRFKAPKDSVELRALYILPEYWRQGLGKLLLDQVIADSRNANLKRIELWCISGNNPAHWLYTKFGFSTTGNERKSSELTGMPLHEIHYVKHL